MQRHQVKGCCCEHTVVAAKTGLDLDRLARHNAFVPTIFKSCQVIGLNSAMPTLTIRLKGREPSVVEPSQVHDLDAAPNPQTNDK